jgi:hypothetical protein
MRLFNEKVFDGVVGPAALYTDAMYDELLGTAERLTISAYVDQVSGTDPLWACVSEHSNDRVNWHMAQGSPEFFIPLTPGVPTAAMAMIAHDVKLGRYVRYAHGMFGGPDNLAHVTLHVCGRGQQLIDIKFPLNPRP